MPAEAIFWRIGSFNKRMKYVLTFFLFTILLIPIYLYYIDVISTINNHFQKIQNNPKVSLSKSSQNENSFANGFNIENRDALKMMDFRHPDCTNTTFTIESSDFNSTRLHKIKFAMISKWRWLDGVVINRIVGWWRHVANIKLKSHLMTITNIILVL